MLESYSAAAPFCRPTEKCLHKRENPNPEKTRIHIT